MSSGARDQRRRCYSQLSDRGALCGDGLHRGHQGSLPEEERGGGSLLSPVATGTRAAEERASGQCLGLISCAERRQTPAHASARGPGAAADSAPRGEGAAR